MGDDERAPQKIKAMRIATRCATIDEFVAGFHAFCDDATCFIPTLGMRPLGLETAFSIQLADGAPVLRGMCVVLDAWATADNPYKRPGLRVGLQRLTPDSSAIIERLKIARREAYAQLDGIGRIATGTEPPRLPTGPIPPRPATSPIPRMEVGELSRPRRPTEDFDAPKTVENQIMQVRTPGSPIILPANPLTALTDASIGAFVDCTMYE
ncbi:MAG: hypothetical protein NT062_01430, partial [Proteobacteria bacterium]|nr:hypothetical protein [Pseudomonadota bacterium]